MTEGVKSCFFDSDDGLRLHYLDFEPESVGDRLPVVCLPGLSRSSRDFGPLALGLSLRSPTPRRVLAFDYRGRGLSDYDPDWHHYDLAHERADFLRALKLLGIERAHIVGTSRGGLHIMALAPEHRALIQSAVFNDIGPVLEIEGLRRIKSYLGKSVSLHSFDEAIALLKIGQGRDFTSLTPLEWRFFAETTFGADGSKLGLRYDPALAHTLDAFDLDAPLPHNWALFDALKGTPLLTIRGANSDLLSEATFATMAARWLGCEAVTVPGQGHAPLLADEPTIDRIANFLNRADTTQPSGHDAEK